MVVPVNVFNFYGIPSELCNIFLCFTEKFTCRYMQKFFCSISISYRNMI